MSKDGMRLVITFLILMLAVSSQAQSRMSSHMHGVAFATLAVDGNNVVLVLESPANNLLGFEHEPSARMQQQLLEKTLSDLANPDRIIQLPSLAFCHYVDAEIESPFSSRTINNGHSDFYISYEFKCRQPTQLSSVDFTVFKTYPRLKMIKVQWISSSNMGYATLNKAQNKLFMR
jgi:hypothetical protein